ncbi:ParB family chromosome partitioning protein [Bacilli bacterium PM5-3]|nr:ParB family chromosome partitioning protein [Bacilli bacterium PM5-3]MDH6603673.1 ParB family chromosome partitioning protein [Bacilli bacterium PM5-9]
MEKQNSRLGKGLEALLGGDVNEIIDEIENNYNSEEVVQLNLNEVSPNPYQPREVFDETKINELAESIKNHGMFTPIIVKKSSSGYNIIAGERRYRASQKLGLETIPALITDFDDRLMMEIALLENIQRENLNPLEEARALKNIMDKYNYTQEEVAKKMGKSRSHIANTLRLLSLNSRIQDLILSGKISMGHAKILVGLDEDVLDIVSNEIVNKKLSVRDTEKLVNELKNKSKPIAKEKKLSPEYIEIEKSLREKLGTKVKIDTKSITVNYENTDDLNRILEILGIEID